MARSVQKWIGASDDRVPPSSVQVRIFERFRGRCPGCGRLLVPGRWVLDHVVPLADGGANAEDNLQPLCTDPCHKIKTGQEATERAPIRRKRAKAIGAKRRRKTIPGRRFDGTPIPSRIVYD